VAFVLPDGSGAVVHRCEQLFDFAKIEPAPELSNRAEHAHIAELHQALSLALNPAFIEVSELAKNAPMSVSLAAPVEDLVHCRGERASESCRKPSWGRQAFMTCREVPRVGRELLGNSLGFP